MIEPHRVPAVDVGQLVRIVVAVDPAVTAGENADETGIVVAGIGRDGQPLPGQAVASPRSSAESPRRAGRSTSAFDHRRA
jgi:phage terminase large subunit-like protein